MAKRKPPPLSERKSRFYCSYQTITSIYKSPPTNLSLWFILFSENLVLKYSNEVIMTPGLLITILTQKGLWRSKIFKLTNCHHNLKTTTVSRHACFSSDAPPSSHSQPHSQHYNHSPYLLQSFAEWFPCAPVNEVPRWRSVSSNLIEVKAGAGALRGSAELQNHRQVLTFAAVP